MAVEVTDNDSLHRFEIAVDGKVAGFAEYRTEPGAVVFTHTEIDPAFEGRGLGSRLIRDALDQTRAAGLQVDPQCPFVRAFIEQHPDYADVVAAA